MTPDAAPPGGGVSLREHLERRIADLDRLVEQRIAAAERAVEIAMMSSKEAISKAESATERRFNGVNEFRQALNDMVNKMMPRIESEERHASAREKIEMMVTRSEAEGRWKVNGDKFDHLEGRFARDIGDLSTRLTRIEGAGVGVKALWGVLLAVIVTASGVIGTVLALSR